MESQLNNIVSTFSHTLDLIKGNDEIFHPENYLERSNETGLGIQHLAMQKAGIAIESSVESIFSQIDQLLESLELIPLPDTIIQSTHNNNDNDTNYTTDEILERDILLCIAERQRKQLTLQRTHEIIRNTQMLIDIAKDNNTKHFDTIFKSD